MKKLSRRDFLKGAAATAASASVLSLMGCATGEGATTTEEDKQAASTTGAVEQQGEKNEITWDHEADVVVVGTGTAITAAIAANDMKLGHVIVLEKSEILFGGTSSLSGGGFALPGYMTDFADENNGDTREKVLSYIKANGEGRMSEEVAVSFVDHAQEYVDWIKATMGWEKFNHLGVYGDYYYRYPDSIPVGRGCAMVSTKEGKLLGGPTMWQAYREYVDAQENITLMMGTAADRLITDEMGRVIGLTAMQGDKEIKIKANKGVVLGTGSFDHDEEMRKAYLAFPIYRTCAVATNTGDGHKMGMRLCAKMSVMDRVFGLPFPYDKPEWDESNDFNYSVMESSALTDWSVHPKLPHSIMVNRKGNRFCNEASQYDVLNRPYAAYDTGVMKYENIPAFFIADAEYASRFTLPYNVSANEELPDYVFKFDTLEELADGMGIDKAGLLDQVARFNQIVENKVDTEWHRGESEDQFNTMRGQAGSKALPGYDPSTELTEMTSTLGTIAKAPFYCVRYVPGSMCTRGGLVVNGNAQVINMDNEAIPGLYAVGTTSAGLAGYWAGGACISQGCVMSYIAVKHIAENA